MGEDKKTLSGKQYSYFDDMFKTIFSGPYNVWGNKKLGGSALECPRGYGPASLNDQVVGASVRMKTFSEEVLDLNLAKRATAEETYHGNGG